MGDRQNKSCQKRNVDYRSLCQYHGKAVYFLLRDGAEHQFRYWRIGYLFERHILSEVTEVWNECVCFLIFSSTWLQMSIAVDMVALV